MDNKKAVIFAAALVAGTEVLGTAVIDDAIDHYTRSGTVFSAPDALKTAFPLAKWDENKPHPPEEVSPPPSMDFIY